MKSKTIANKVSSIPNLVAVDEVVSSIKRVSPWSLPQFSRTDRRNIKLLFLLAVVAIESTSEIYVRLPQEIIYGRRPDPIPFAADSEDAESVVVIFPGAGGPDYNTDKLQRSITDNDRIKGIHRVVSVYDWSAWTGNYIRAAFDSQIVGKTVCSGLAKNGLSAANHPLKSLHAIGISVGAFAADSCIKSFNQEMHQVIQPDPAVAFAHNRESNADKDLVIPTKTRTRLTLLDPFTSKGVFGYGWGLKNFGKSADIVEDYLNTDDPVPTTNEAVQDAFTYDITSAEEKKLFVPLSGESFHSWPVAYLANHWHTDTDSQGVLLFPSSEQEPRGVTVVVP